MRFELVGFTDRVYIAENYEGTIRFVVNPSNAWIPTTGDGGIAKWQLNQTGTRASYVTEPTNFELKSIVKDGSKEGQYIATIKCLHHDPAITNYAMSLVLNAGTDTAPVLISSTTFVMGTVWELGVNIGGIMWATRNVDEPGTFADKPESHGLLYQWGSNVGWSETDPITSTASHTGWAQVADLTDVQYWRGERSPCPDGWRPPRKDEFEILIDSSTNKWVNAGQTAPSGRTYTVGGHEFIDKTVPANVLFLPITNYRDGNFGGRQESTGLSNRYWMITSANTNYSDAFGFGNGTTLNTMGGNLRTAGHTVRCMKDE
jgi:uncharacterized protein (TIGR02145 family)